MIHVVYVPYVVPFVSSVFLMAFSTSSESADRPPLSQRGSLQALAQGNVAKIAAELWKNSIFIGNAHYFYGHVQLLCLFTRG